MKYPAIVFLVIVSVSIALLPACGDKYENYTSSPNDVLSFSHDTLSFDTLFSGVGSTTMAFMVYNHHDKPLLIRSVHLSGAGNSGFRINVDGFSGTSFYDVEIRSKDSMYVFVETTPKENNANTPLIQMDSILFLTNGITQKVILKAYGQDVYILKGGSYIETDSVLPNNKPYLIYDSLVVRENVRLTIPEGVTLYMHDDAEIDIYGTLKIEGLLSHPVTIRGDKPTTTAGVSYDRLPGQWAGIYFAPESFDNEIDHAHIRNGKRGLVFDTSTPDRSKLKLSNSVLTNVYYDLFSAENCHIEASNCEFSNAGGALVYLNGGKYRFTHCTLANYFVWSVRSLAAVCLQNYRMQDSDTVPLPLEQADFLNCIIYGHKASEIELYPGAKQAGNALNYRLDYCLLKLEDNKFDNTHIYNYILNRDPLFRQTDDREGYIFDFRLKENSPAVNKGDSRYSVLYPLDLDGMPRPEEEADLGAYEYSGNQ
ncbi:MAG: hypothetical protein LBC40_03370 [Dysgonamonadaceae bacterium]|jgi:hypothetical protein|nr:hypothetical protein [Dysgonamonadaceae bacterium]